MPSEPATVLIVDDNPDHRELLRLVGASVAPTVRFVTVNDGLEALAYLQGTPPFDDRGEYPLPALVLLDLMMPRMDGFGVLARLQSAEAAVRPPVVVLTSSLNPVDEARALALGADGFHTKPSDPRDLATLLLELLDRWVT